MIDYDDYKKNDPRMWLFHTKFGKILIIIFLVVVFVSIIYEEFIE
jgi:hypothetical protein